MPSHRPNILWLMTDEQRCDSLGCYGSPWARTPNLDAIAAEGVVFAEAVTPSPVCLPARLSILTGRHPSRTGVWWNDNHGHQFPMLTAPFIDAGYQVASFGKHHWGTSQQPFPARAGVVLSEAVHYFEYRKGRHGADHGMVQYPPQPYPWIFGGTFPEPAEQTAEAINVDHAIRWLEGRDDDAPFFLRVSVNAPHTPVTPPPPFDTLIAEDDIHLPADAETMPDGAPRWIADSLATYARADRLEVAAVRALRRFYFGMVAFVDHQFGRLLDHLRAKGLLDNTIVAYVSDHGTHLGDYGLVQKQTFYQPVVRVPLFFRLPPSMASRAVHPAVPTPVEITSLLPTLLDLVGLEIPESCDAHSLAHTLLTGAPPAPRPVFSELTLGSFGCRHHDRLVMVRDGRWKFSLCLDPHPHDECLHDVLEDPCERRNLAGQARFAEVQRRLTRLVDDHIAAGRVGVFNDTPPVEENHP